MTIAVDRASEVDVTAEDLAELEGLPGSTSPQAGGESEAEDLQGGSQAGSDDPASDSATAAGEDEGDGVDDEKLAADLALLDAEIEGDEEDDKETPDPNGDKSDKENADNGSEEEVEDPENEDAADDAGQDGDEEDPDPEVVEQIRANYEKQWETVEDKIGERFIPLVAPVAESVSAARTELSALEAKFSTPDEDGYTPQPTFQENIRAWELRDAIKQGESKLSEYQQQVNAATAKVQTEYYIRNHFAMYPKLKAVEDGFRKAVAQGVQFDSIESALAVSRALSTKAKDTSSAASKPAKAATPKPTAAEVQQKVLQQNIDKKAQMKVTAGKGSGGKGAASKPANPYAGMPSEMADHMKYFDDFEKNL